MARVDEFKAQLAQGGARANQFVIQLNFPTWVAGGALAGQSAQFLCKSSQLPASSVENIQVAYRGRPANFSGERTFAPWNISIYNSTNFNIRNALEQWQTGIQNHGATNGRTAHTEYQVDLAVIQLDRNGAPLKTYNLVNAYPTNIGEIELDYDNQNQLEIFPVQFVYDYFTSNTTENGSPFSIGVSVSTPFGTFPIQV